LKFEEIYRENYEFVWQTLRHMGTSERDVQDVIQKVFIIAHRRLPEFSGRSSLKTWICGIALRVASDYRRSAVVRREVLSDEAQPDIGTEAMQLHHLEQQEQLSELDEILTELPFEQRTVFVLFELQEMSGEDIAKLQGVSEGTVRSRLRLARQAFWRAVEIRRNHTCCAAAVGDP
jgi:RNA polymerase sigma-70 factor (ECF subfamily)